MDNQGKSTYDLIIMGLEQLNDDLKELRKGVAIIERESREGISQLRVTVAKLETKIGIYASIGALVGSAFMTWLVETLKH